MSNELQLKLSTKTGYRSDETHNITLKQWCDIQAILWSRPTTEEGRMADMLRAVKDIVNGDPVAVLSIRTDFNTDIKRVVALGLGELV